MFFKTRHQLAATFAAKSQLFRKHHSGEAFLLQDGGFEATLYAQVQNVLINKSGIGPFADFSFLRVGDNLGIQNVNDQNFGVYVVTSIHDFNTFWDFSVVPMKGIVVGAVAEFDQQIKLRSTRPVFTVAQDTAPYFSESGQLWYDTANDALMVWDQEDGEFYRVGGEDPDEIDLTPITDDIEKNSERLDNVEQLQRDLHNIVSEGYYSYPSFSLSDPWPNTAQYILATTAYDPDNANQGIGGAPLFFEEAKYLRISAVSGSHAHLERAEVGDYLTIQTVGTDAGGKYVIEHIRQNGTSGPTLAYEMGIKFVEGLAYGNIIIPNDAQIQVVKPAAIEDPAPQSEFGIRTYISRGKNYFDLADGTASFNTGTYSVAPIDKDFYYDGRKLYINGYRVTLKDVKHQEDPDNPIGLQTQFKFEEYNQNVNETHFSKLAPAGEHCTFSEELPYITKEYVDVEVAEILEQIQKEEFEEIGFGNRRFLGAADDDDKGTMRNTKYGQNGNTQANVITQMVVSKQPWTDGSAPDITDDDLKLGDFFIIRDEDKVAKYEITKIQPRATNYSLDLTWLADESSADFELLRNSSKYEIFLQMGELQYVKLSGDEMTGALKTPELKSTKVNSGENSNLLLQHNGNTKVYVGAGEITFQEKVKLNKEGTESYHAVTKGYVDANAGGFTPGEKVAKNGSTGVEVGGFFIENGNLYCKIS